MYNHRQPKIKLRIQLLKLAIHQCIKLLPVLITKYIIYYGIKYVLPIRSKYPHVCSRAENVLFHVYSE